MPTASTGMYTTTDRERRDPSWRPDAHFGRLSETASKVSTRSCAGAGATQEHLGFATYALCQVPLAGMPGPRPLSLLVPGQNAQILKEERAEEEPKYLNSSSPLAAGYLERLKPIGWQPTGRLDTLPTFPTDSARILASKYPSLCHRRGISRLHAYQGSHRTVVRSAYSRTNFRIISPAKDLDEHHYPDLSQILADQKTRAEWVHGLGIPA